MEEGEEFVVSISLFDEYFLEHLRQSCNNDDRTILSTALDLLNTSIYLQMPCLRRLMRSFMETEGRSLDGVLRYVDVTIRGKMGGEQVQLVEEGGVPLLLPLLTTPTNIVKAVFFNSTHLDRNTSRELIEEYGGDFALVIRGKYFIVDWHPVHVSLENGGTCKFVPEEDGDYRKRLEPDITLDLPAGQRFEIQPYTKPPKEERTCPCVYAEDTETTIFVSH